MAWTVMYDVMQWVDGNGDPASGYVIKAYLPGTTTPTSIAIDKNGGSPQATITLNAEGKPEVSGNEVMLFIDRDYKWAVFANASDAAANSNPYAGFYDNVPYLSENIVDNGGTSTTLQKVLDASRLDLVSDAPGVDVSSLYNGQPCFISEDRVGGSFFYRYSLAHGITSIEGFEIRVDDDWYLQRTYENKTVEPKTWYVDPTLGTDGSGFGESTGVNAFRTIQYAYDQLPSTITHQQTIQLADGTYNTNYLDSAQSVALPRPAILFGRGKFIASRTQKSGNDLEGGVIIKGNQTTPANVIIEPGDTYTYGIYNGQSQLGVQDLIIKTAAGATAVNNLITAHRNGARVHTVSVSLDGASKSVTERGMLCESGGEIEFTTGSTGVTVKNCDILGLALTTGDLCTISGDYSLSDANIGLQANGNSEVKVDAVGVSGQTISNCSTAAVFAQFGGYINIRGGDNSNHTLITSKVQAESGGIIRFVWVDTDASIEIIESTLKLNNSDFQQQATIRAGDIHLDGVDSFISPDTANDSTVPIGLLNGSRIYKEGTNNIVGSSGLNESYNPITLTYSNDSETQAISDSSNIYRINGNGATRLTCEIDATDIADGRTIFVDGDTWGVEFTSGTNMDVPTNFTIGNGTGQYSGAVFTMRNSKWRVNALGQVRP